MALQVYAPLSEILRRLKNSGKDVVDGVPRVMSPLLVRALPSVPSQVKTGILRTPDNIVALQISWYMFPATALPTGIMDKDIAPGGTETKKRDIEKLMH